MRKCELIKQSGLLKIRIIIRSNLFNEKYGLKLGLKGLNKPVLDRFKVGH